MHRPWLRELITEVCRDAVIAEMLKENHSARAAARITTLFSHAVYTFVMTKGAKSSAEFEVPMTDFKAFALMCRILDRIEKTIPVAGNIQVVCKEVSRDDLQEWVASQEDGGETH